MKILLFLLLSFLSLHAEDYSKRQQELESIQSTLEAERARLAKIRVKERNQLYQVFRIQRQIHVVNRNLHVSKQRLQASDIKLKGLQTELSSLEQDYQKQRQYYFSRVRSIYQQKNLGYVGYFFSERPKQDYANDQYYFQRLIHRDVEVLGEIAGGFKQIQQKKSQVSLEKRNISYLIGAIQKQNQYYQQQAFEQQKIYTDLKKERQEYENRVALLEQQSQEIEQYLRQRISDANGNLKKYGTGRFIWPIVGRISSYYGMRRHPIFKTVKMHRGIDVASGEGVPIAAADSGEVIYAGWWGSQHTGYGRVVIVAHGGGLTTVYAHQSRIRVKEGDTVEKGETVGYVGSTGYTTGPHLHFEVRRSGKTQNPLAFLPNR